MNFYKVLSLFLALAIVFCSFVSCGDKDNADDKPPVDLHKETESATAGEMLDDALNNFVNDTGNDDAKNAENSATTNIFTLGNVDIELTETTGTTYQIVPGNKITKDPTVTVDKASENAWVFVKIEEVNNVDAFLSYTIAEGWTALVDVDNDGIADDGVYYREYAVSADGASYEVIADNTVTVKTDVTKKMLNDLTTNTQPQIKVTAYAIQKDNVTTAETAWAEISTAVQG